MKRNALLSAAQIIVLAVLYFAAARLGLSMASVHTNVSPVWPPTGIAIAAILLIGYRAWPGILLGAFVANFFTPVSFPVAAAIAVGNTLEAVSAGVLLRSLGFHNSLDRVKDVTRFVIVAVLAPMISTTIGNLSLCLSHSAAWSQFGSLWVTWWFGDLLGAVTLAPLLLTWAAGPRDWLPHRRYVEAIVLMCLVATAARLTFGSTANTGLPYFPAVRLIVPFFLWASLRLRQRGVTLATVIVSALAVWGTAHGLGPFAGRGSNEALLQLQLFVGANAITFLFLAAVVEERRMSEQSARESERRLAGNLAVSRILAESPALSDAMPRILQTIGETLGWELGVMWAPDAEGKLLRCQHFWHAPSANVDKFKSISLDRKIASGTLLPGRVWERRKPVWIPDVATETDFPRASAAIEEGLHAAFGFPILFRENVLGVMDFFSQQIREPDDALLAMFGSIGNQIGQFIERKQAEDALLRNRQALKDANKVARGGSWQWNLVTNDGEWSEEYHALLGLDPAVTKLSSAEWLSRVHPDDLERALKTHEEAIANKLDVQVEYRIRRADGEWRWFNRTGKCIYDEAGKPASMIGITFDVTDRKRAEEALRQSEEQLRLALEAANMGAWEYQIQGGKITWSSGLAAIHGMAPERFGGTLDDYKREIHPADRRRVIESLTRTIEQGTEHEVEYRIVRPDGSIRWVEGRGRVTRNRAGEAVRMSGVCTDITERKNAEQERQQLLLNEHAARAEAEAANRTKDEFLATLSHELRTPLNAIVGWASMLRSGRLDEENVRHALEIIDRNAKVQTQLIEDILDVSRIVSGKVRLEIHPVELATLIEAAADSVRPAAQSKNLQLQIEIEASVGPVAGDSARLQQIIWNLLSNAVKFTPTGGKVSVHAKAYRNDVEIVVSDTGQGISADMLPFVFERFRQADGSITRTHKGLGLGLAIVRHLVELHGGSVTAASSGEGKGATFTVSLPLLVGWAESPIKRSADHGTEGATDGRGLQGLRVLAVDDEEDARELLTTILLNYGAEVKAADSAAEALALMTKWHFDVLISDIEMPGIDGYSFIRQVRSLENSEHVPAIALTAHARAADRERALQAGFHLHVSKPVAPAELETMLLRLTHRT